MRIRKKEINYKEIKNIHIKDGEIRNRKEIHFYWDDSKYYVTVEREKKKWVPIMIYQGYTCEHLRIEGYRIDERLYWLREELVDYFVKESTVRVQLLTI